MKGIAHFLTGVALATCIPEVVVLAREGSLLPVLGGMAGLLPDLLDFRLGRFLARYDTEIDPGTDLAASSAGVNELGIATISPQAVEAAAETVAEAFADAMQDAFATGIPRRLIAHTVRCGADLWRRYTIRIDPEAQAIAARIGPLVTTSQAVVPGSDLSAPAWAERRLDFPLSHSYQRVYEIDIFSGPSFRFSRQGPGLAVEFLDWHHGWTHSLPLSTMLGLAIGFLVSCLWGPRIGLFAGLVAGLACAAHALVDQLGHMGCNLLWPFSRRRWRGYGLLHASDPAPNFLTVWSSLALILYNLDHAGSTGAPGLLPMMTYLAVAVAGPWFLYAVLMYWRHFRATTDGRRPSAGDVSWDDLANVERIAETQDGEMR